MEDHLKKGKKKKDENLVTHEKRDTSVTQTLVFNLLYAYQKAISLEMQVHKLHCAHMYFSSLC